MKIRTLFAILSMAAVSLTAQDKTKGKAPAGPGLTLTTTAFADGAEIPTKYTMSDPNAVSPKLEWTNVPPGTVTFTLILHDPDVSLQRKNDDVLHWMIFNI